MKSLENKDRTACLSSLMQAQSLLSSPCLQEDKQKLGLLISLTMNNQACYYKE